MVLAFLDRVPRGPRALVVEGEAGIGKSTVWFESVRLAEARGYRVLRSRPAEREAKRSYAAFADVVGPAFDDAREQLPDPQELALAAALLRIASSEPADPRTAATAVVGVLTELVRERPVVIAIDDVQWVDLASRRALEFAVRRLPAQVGLFVTRRSGGGAEVPLGLDPVPLIWFQCTDDVEATRERHAREADWARDHSDETHAAERRSYLAVVEFHFHLRWSCSNRDQRMLRHGLTPWVGGDKPPAWLRLAVTLAFTALAW